MDDIYYDDDRYCDDGTDDDFIEFGVAVEGALDAVDLGGVQFFAPPF